MSTDDIGFYEEVSKIISLIIIKCNSNTHFICLSGRPPISVCTEKVKHVVTCHTTKITTKSLV